MPQIVKGGKYIFGLSIIRKNGEIRIPDEALLEYGLVTNERVILISGSKTSGGFGVIRKENLEQSKLKIVLIQNPKLASFQIDEGSIIKFKERLFSWVPFHKNGLIVLPRATLQAFEINAGDHLFAARGSGLAIAMIIKGPIIEEAKKHPEIRVFS